MRRDSFVCRLLFNMLVAIAAELPAQGPTPESTARRRFNQVFAKVIVSVTSRTPRQDGSVVESWVAEQLKQPGVPEYSAVTVWEPACDGLLADDAVDNRVWGGGFEGRHSSCPVSGDISDRENGRLLVRVAGWSPGSGFEANIMLPGEPGSRAVGPVQIDVGKETKPVKVDKRLPYVAISIAPPPPEGVTSHSDADKAEQRGEREPTMTQGLKSWPFGGGPVTFAVLSQKS